ncbi:(2Fe-2S)-binding protein [Pseudaminobacter soli (ex Li et al. 2025)]|uniref:Sarcosine oxidase subunit alpha n=1 Tax=Pseudaminobacter soli (ex Li et al. 2025) TaxID=1295366 RepID=A0A2P7S0W4_9HYPH|nr:(2Fe-2S)-binding protein [Mesorhizobium soli]PSJ56073.1 sarcosine oxidase subunit alpha [Mesorhizobium soli]
MLLRIRDAVDKVTFTFDGAAVQAARGDTLAAALLAAGIDTFRISIVGREPRAPYCLMGVCFECLVTIDDIQNRQSCLVEVQEGMVVTSQNGARTIGRDDGL